MKRHWQFIRLRGFPTERSGLDQSGLYGVRWQSESDERRHRFGSDDSAGLRSQSGVAARRLALPPHSTERHADIRGFTLVELMVVMLIIGILASFAVPAMKGLGQANRSAAAHRQILDDLALARLKAINDRANVYMVFATPLSKAAFTPALPGETPAQSQNRLRQLSNLLAQTFTSYALVSTRTVGDQPGRPIPHYLTEWKSLPDGYVFAPYKFTGTKGNVPNEYDRTLHYNAFPFPSSRSRMTNQMPSIGFNAQGQLLSQRDEVIALAKGSVFPARLPDGTLALTAPDVQLSPQPNFSLPPATQTNSYQFVRINWLTGRARVELPEFRQ